MPDELRDKAVGGAKWAMLTSYGGQVIGAASNLTLAWLLDPRDWGLVAAAMVVIGVVRACGNFGVNYALVQWRGDVRRAAPTALTLLLGISLLAYGVIAAVAPFTKGYFKDPAVPLLTLLLALSLLCKPPSVVAEGTMRRDFHLRAIFFVEFTSQLLAAGAAVTTALLLPKSQRYWALVVGGLGWEVMRAALSWWLTNVPLRLGFDREAAKGLLHYGKFFLGSSILMALYLSVDQLAIGHIGSPIELGLYGFALQWVSQLGIITGTIFGGVAVPLYARLQDDRVRLRYGFCRIVSYSAIISTALLMGLVLVIPEAVRLILPPSYFDTVPIFQVLGLYYIVRAVDNCSGQLFAAIGKPNYDMYLNAVNLVAMLAPMVPLVYYMGPVGAALALLFARVVRLVVNVAFCRRALSCALAHLVHSVLPAAAAGVVMASTLLATKALAAHAGLRLGWAGLVGLIVLGAAVYVAVLFLAYRELLFNMARLIRDALLPGEGTRGEGRGARESQDP